MKKAGLTVTRPLRLLPLVFASNLQPQTETLSHGDPQLLNFP
jgi:hypothetical protein